MNNFSRQKNGNALNKSLIYGKHPFFSVLKAGKRKIYQIFVSKKNQNEFLNFLKENQIELDRNIVLE